MSKQLKELLAEPEVRGILEAGKEAPTDIEAILAKARQGQGIKHP